MSNRFGETTSVYDHHLRCLAFADGFVHVDIADETEGPAQHVSRLIDPDE
jgi:hypothetical protein